MTDSASDISKETEKEFNIKVIDFKVTIDGNCFDARNTYTKEEFYSILEESKNLPLTSQISPLDFENIYFNATVKGYSKILIILINSKGSGTFNNAILARSMLFDDHKELAGKIDIRVFDGCSYTGAYGQVVVDAAEMAKNGEDFDVICDYVAKKLPKRKIYFGMYTLKYAAKSGRIPSAAAFVGETLAIKPIMRIYNNEISTAKKVHGDKKIISAILDLVEEEMVNGAKYSVVYGSDTELKEEMIHCATIRFGYQPLNCYQIGAAVAINAGPKVIGIIFDSEK